MCATMSAREKKEDLLSSWKEIAAYLDCGERTCRRWEKKYGLPVYRIDPDSKARVYSYKDELDKWLRERINSKSTHQNQIRRHFWLNKKIYLSLFIIFFGILSIAFVIIKKSRTPNPANFKIKNSELIVLDQKGKELWRYDTGIKDLLDENEYRSHFQIRRNNSNPPFDVLLPFLIIDDINHDEKKEILFCTHTQDRYGGGILFCFNHNGDLLWDFKAGRKIKFGQQEYSSDFWVRGFEICDLDDNGNHEIILIAHALHFFPTILVVLNINGKILGEYWNSGHLGGMAFFDLNGNGNKEIIAIGQNNEYAKACIIVFDSNQLKGSSPQINSKYKCDDLTSGSEIFYILLPRTDLDILESPAECVKNIYIQDNRQILAETHVSGIYFRFDCNLNLQGVRLSHAFERLHKKLLLEVKIKSELNKEKYKKELESGLLYYDGEKWVNHHAMSNPWNDIEK